MAYQSAEQRRLLRILHDEDYGPKLARLGKADERAVLNLIEQNRGREARKEIVKRDEARRHRERVTARVRRYRKQPSLTGANWPADEETLFWQIFAATGGS